MGKVIDLVGHRYGRLTVVGVSDRLSRYAYWKCVCDCGSVGDYIGNNLRKGNTSSCGCLRSEVIKRSGGLSDSVEYEAWMNMRQRCSKQNHPGYSHYGARGITVASEWDTFNQFYADMGPRPSPRHTLERVDNSRGYGPTNCRWATYAEQARNTRRSRYLTLHGETLCLTDWATKTGLSVGAIRKRLLLGWTVEKSLLTPVRKVAR